MSFCTPATIYLVISIISLVINFVTNFNVVSSLIKGLFILGWCWLLNFLCVQGYSTISWILVILPLFVMFI
jgi:predicted metal-binding membrane protein